MGKRFDKDTLLKMTDEEFDNHIEKVKKDLDYFIKTIGHQLSIEPTQEYLQYLYEISYEKKKFTMNNIRMRRTDGVLVEVVQKDVDKFLQKKWVIVTGEHLDDIVLMTMPDGTVMEVEKELVVEKEKIGWKVIRKEIEKRMKETIVRKKKETFEKEKTELMFPEFDKVMNDVASLLISYIDVSPPDDYKMDAKTGRFNFRHTKDTKRDRNLIARVLNEEFGDKVSVSEIDERGNFFVESKIPEKKVIRVTKPEVIIQKVKSERLYYMYFKQDNKVMILREPIGTKIGYKQWTPDYEGSVYFYIPGWGETEVIGDREKDFILELFKSDPKLFWIYDLDSERITMKELKRKMRDRDF